MGEAFQLMHRLPPDYQPQLVAAALALLLLKAFSLGWGPLKQSPEREKLGAVGLGCPDPEQSSSSLNGSSFFPSRFEIKFEKLIVGQ